VNYTIYYKTSLQERENRGVRGAAGRPGCLITFRGGDEWKRQGAEAATAALAPQPSNPVSADSRHRYDQLTLRVCFEL
jgi:hypothetical protein